MRVFTSDANVGNRLRDLLVDFVVEDDGLLGYKLECPSGMNRLFVLLSGSGQLLGRSRRESEIVELLLRHLGNRLIGEPSENHLRLELRALAGATNAALLGPFIGSSPPFIERQLGTRGLAMIDAAFVDVDPLTGAIAPQQRPENWPHGIKVRGHVAPSDISQTLSELFWFAEHLPDEISGSLVTSELCRASRNGTREFRLAASRQLSSTVTTRLLQSTSALDAMDAFEA